MAICSTVSHHFIHVRFYPQGSPAHPPLLRHPFPFFHFLPCHQSRGHSCVFGPRFTDSGRNLVCFQSSHILLHGNLHVISCSLEFDPIPLRSRNPPTPAVSRGSASEEALLATRCQKGRRVCAERKPAPGGHEQGGSWQCRNAGKVKVWS